MPVYADPIDGVVLPADALNAWTARVVERMGTPSRHRHRRGRHPRGIGPARHRLTRDGTAAALRGPHRRRGHGPRGPPRAAALESRPGPLRRPWRLGPSCRPGRHGRGHRGRPTIGHLHGRGAELQPLRHRGLVCPASGGRRAHRHQPHQHLAARGAHARRRRHARHQSRGHRGARRPPGSTSASTWPPRPCRGAGSRSPPDAGSRCIRPGPSTPTASPRAPPWPPSRALSCRWAGRRRQAATRATA